MNTFPTEINAWKNDVARRLVTLRGTFNDLMMNMPMIPDPEIGQPFTGPLSPVPFEWPTRPDRSGGTNTGGTPNTGGTLTTGGSGCIVTNPAYTCVMSGFTGQAFVGGTPYDGTWIFRRNLALPCSLSYTARKEGSGTDNTVYWTLAGNNYSSPPDNTSMSGGGYLYRINSGTPLWRVGGFTLTYVSGGGGNPHPTTLDFTPI